MFPEHVISWRGKEIKFTPLLFGVIIDYPHWLHRRTIKGIKNMVVCGEYTPTEGAAMLRQANIDFGAGLFTWRGQAWWESLQTEIGQIELIRQVIRQQLPDWDPAGPNGESVTGDTAALYKDYLYLDENDTVKNELYHDIILPWLARPNLRRRGEPVRTMKQAG